MYIQSYKGLIVWQKSINLVEEIYILTRKFPKEEIYGLVSQERRAAVSIPSNIAEGQRRKDIPEFLHFLRIADASSAELETQLIISKKMYPDLDYSKANSLLEEIQKMLTVMMSKLELKANSSKLKAHDGFTMVEMLVGMALFITVISASTTVFINSMRTQRAIVALLAVQSNISLAIEQISREVRTGKDFSLDGENLQFTNANNQKVAYIKNGDFIEKVTDGVIGKMTAGNVIVTRLKFILKGNLPADGRPPQVTILMSFAPKNSIMKDVTADIQTTISSRVLDG